MRPAGLAARTGPFLFAAGLLALLAAATRLRLEYTVEFADPGWDRHYYLQAARDGPWDFHIAPYCWRVLAPLIARASPLQGRFFLVAAAWLVAVGLASTGGGHRAGGAFALAPVPGPDAFALDARAQAALAGAWALTLGIDRVRVSLRG